MLQRTNNSTSSTQDMRNAVDERLPLVLSTLGYQESFILVDTKLALGYLSVLAAGGAFLLEKKLKFEEGLPYLKLLLLAYFILTSLSWLYQKFVIKNTIYTGKKGKNVVTIGGEVDKYTPEYKLTITVKSEGRDVGSTQDVVLPFTSVFDKYGNLHEGELAAWIKDQLELNEKNK